MVTFDYSVREFIALVESYLDKGLLPLAAVNQAVHNLGKEYGLEVERVSVSGWPLYSLTASGRFRDKVFVTRSGQETHVRPYRIPRDPKTQKQLDHRQKFKTISQQWKSLTPEQKESYNQLAEQEGGLSGYNYYVREKIRYS